MQIVKGVGILVVSAVLVIGCREDGGTTAPQKAEATAPGKTPETPPKKTPAASPPKAPGTTFPGIDDIIPGATGEEPVKPDQSENGGETEVPEIPVAEPVPDKPGFVISPFNGKWIDVTGVKPGTVMADPYYPEEKKFFRVPEIPVQPEPEPAEETPAAEAPEGEPAEVEEPEV